MLSALIDTLGPGPAQALWKWLTVDHRGWAQQGWRRLDQARADDCQSNPPD